MPVLPSYRNQSIDLLCKSIDWFLHEGNSGTYWTIFMVFSCLVEAQNFGNGKSQVKMFKSKIRNLKIFIFRRYLHWSWHFSRVILEWKSKIVLQYYNNRTTFKLTKKILREFNLAVQWFSKLTQVSNFAIFLKNCEIVKFNTQAI